MKDRTWRALTTLFVGAVIGLSLFAIVIAVKSAELVKKQEQKFVPVSSAELERLGQRVESLEAELLVRGAELDELRARVEATKDAAKEHVTTARRREAKIVIMVPTEAGARESLERAERFELRLQALEAE